MHIPTLILSLWSLFLHHSTQCSMHASKRRKGLSRKVHVSGFSYTGEQHNEVLSQAAVARERTAGQERYRLNITGLSQDTLNVLGEIRTELPHEDFIATDAMDHDGQNGDWEPIPESWNKDETIVHAIRDFVDHRVEAFSKVICDSYKMTLSHNVSGRIRHLLNYGPLHREKAKRMLQVGDRQRGDMREYANSDYMLPQPYVNQFANEVWLQPMPADTSEPEDVVPAIGNDDDADTEDSSRQVMSSDCSKNWKAAAGEEKKQMWSIFDETGLFVAACRHGLLLWVTDMVRSGELAKYPLAIISKILEVLGEHNLGAYDIGCGFALTISSSSLGEAFKKQGCHMSSSTYSSNNGMRTSTSTSLP
ncbi:uncharacterized protein EDB93DRAFT_1102647 [Suillus bovinus]|uniref:uncharacterized protein n=1 Tax=Suillus bovinus TaxID=48563 RepID=UPI001B886535|nr:uncharacterized protein EDB93DRAFT_1102647 [Suillus bovinus]KAG2153503.1 hypothetical protein EDB93DRAFT_1102647 [Suillus bovinus]